jgi:hypothetical protein
MQQPWQQRISPIPIGAEVIYPKVGMIFPAIFSDNR